MSNFFGWLGATVLVVLVLWLLLAAVECWADEMLLLLGLGIFAGGFGILGFVVGSLLGWIS